MAMAVLVVALILVGIATTLLSLVVLSIGLLEFAAFICIYVCFGVAVRNKDRLSLAISVVAIVLCILLFIAAAEPRGYRLNHPRKYLNLPFFLLSLIAVAVSGFSVWRTDQTSAATDSEWPLFLCFGALALSVIALVVRLWMWGISSIVKWLFSLF